MWGDGRVRKNSQVLAGATSPVHAEARGEARLRQLSRSCVWRGGRASGIIGLKLRAE